MLGNRKDEHMRWVRKLFEGSNKPLEGSMREAKTMQEFLHTIVDSPACVLVAIPDLPHCLDALLAGLKSRFPNTNEVTNAFFNNVRAVCPKCCVWIPPQTLSGVHTTTSIGRDKVTFTNYGPQAHLLDGHCVLDSCQCEDLVLIWKGPQPFRAQVTMHISRIRHDAQQKSEQAKLACLDQLEDKTVLDFTTDTIWALWKNAVDRHLYLRREFPCFSESPNLILWVSVIPYPKETAGAVFSGGYPTFLSQILNESEHDTGKVSVAHWISMGPTSETSYVNLALASKLELPKTERFLVMPDELVRRS
jgi:hypothetical protein